MVGGLILFKDVGCWWSVPMLCVMWDGMDRVVFAWVVDFVGGVGLGRDGLSRSWCDVLVWGFGLRICGLWRERGWFDLCLCGVWGHCRLNNHTTPRPRSKMHRDPRSIHVPRQWWASGGAAGAAA